MSRNIKAALLIGMLLAIIGGTIGLTQLKTPQLLNTDGVIFQKSEMGCGLAAAQNIVKQFGKNPAALDTLLHVSENGLTLLEIKTALTTLGCSCSGFRTTPDDLPKLSLPMIAHLNGNHFVVLESVSEKDIVLVDPSIGRVKYPAEQFVEKWDGVVLCVTPKP